MQRSRIEWTDYTLNPIKGLCPVDCKDNQGKSYCYARRMYKRFHLRSDGTINPAWDYKIRFEYADTLRALHSIKEPSRIFVGSTMELFGDWVKPAWQNKMFCEIPFMFPQHTFIFLTKQPQNLIKWEFPPNCWVGVTITDEYGINPAYWELSRVNAEVKFLSIEPLLHWKTEAEQFCFRFDFINWLIIGQQTPIKKATMPKIEWIMEIVEACDKANISIFLKDNLKPLILGDDKTFYDARFVADCGLHKLRQEFPKL